MSMFSFSDFEQNLDRAREISEHMAAHTRRAAELTVNYGQAVQVQLASQASGARERLASCIDGLANAGDPKAASQVSVSYLTDTVKAYGQDLAQWSQLVTQTYQCALQTTALDDTPGV